MQLACKIGPGFDSLAVWCLGSFWELVLEVAFWDMLVGLYGLLHKSNGFLFPIMLNGDFPLHYLIFYLIIICLLPSLNLNIDTCFTLVLVGIPPTCTNFAQHCILILTHKNFSSFSCIFHFIHFFLHIIKSLQFITFPSPLCMTRCPQGI